MRELPYRLAQHERAIVLRVIRNVCEHRGWLLEACHVRSTHLHFVVTSDASPEKVMNDLKAYSSRGLNAAGGPRKKRWARHGSVRRIGNHAQLVKVVRYVIDGQGERMAVWPGDGSSNE